MNRSDILNQLYEVLRERIRERPTNSYVTSLVDAGHGRIAEKVREEAEELIEATAGSDRAHSAHEAADLLFHVWVLLANAGIEPSEVYDELSRRFGTSGIEEKAGRGRDTC